MPEVIRKDGAVGDIEKDATDTLEAAKLRGDPWDKLAEDHLGPVLGLIETVKGQVKKAETQSGVAAKALAISQEKACKLVGKTYDDLWNAIGRPAYDAYFALLFPGGCSCYTDGAVEGLPRRMRMLAGKLRQDLHPQITAATATAAADALEAEAAALATRIEEARAQGDELKIYQQTHDALARATQMELVNLKRQYKSAGMRETEIHKVIPGYTRKRQKKGEAKAASKPPSKPEEKPQEKGEAKGGPKPPEKPEAMPQEPAASAPANGA
jgi:hypothetical protein